MSASSAAKSRPARRRAGGSRSRFAPATNWPSRSVSSATISPLNADRARASRGSAPKAARISSSVDGPEAAARAPQRASPPRAGRRRGRARARPSPSRYVTGIAFDVAASRCRGSSASASIVVIAGRLDLLRRVERRRGTRRARHAARDLEVGGVVAALARDERVLARARRREVVDRLARRPSSPTPPRPRRTRARSGRRSAGTPLLALGS